MAKSSDNKKRAKLAASKPKALEFDPDAWPKFEALVKSAAKMGHKPHQKSVLPKKVKPKIKSKRSSSTV